ncbi:MAG: NAD-dependent epimerase/dehydratase family protein [Pseudomonadales bacterium]|nr:NAD-dependent epimerase/dehydratase family protein [Pseudomonadales bacterium]
MEKTALVTGAAGFVGQALVLRLLERGFTVKALDLPGNPEFSKFTDSLSALQQASFIACPADITDADSLKPILSDVSYVFHSAALLNSIAPRSRFESVNVQGTKNICNAASNADVERFILVSTSDVFGIPNPSEVITEKTAYRSWGEPYADTKIKACNIVKDFQQKGLLHTTIIYPGWVYGPGDRQFFPAIIDMIKDKHAFIWHRTEPYCVDLIYINDLISAIVKAAESPSAIGEDYLILDDNTEITPEQFFHYIAEQLHIKLKIHKLPYQIMYAVAWISQQLKQRGFIKNLLLSTTDVKAFGNNFEFSNKKARNALQWAPSLSAKEGIKSALDWQIRNN